MSDPDQPPGPDRLTELLNEGDDEETRAHLERLGSADVDARKRALRAVRDVADERPGDFEGLAPALSPFLTDEDRAVRLTSAKLFVTLAASEPATVLPVVDSLADRLADDGEFYYVRARCAEALGYVAVESPDAVTDPAILAELHIGLSFDEPEVKEKLAKALAFVALGDPGRLRHRVDSLADHLDDDNEVVRYYLCTALAAVGCERPLKVADATDSLRERLTDENPYVRGRAAEALGLVAEPAAEIEVRPGFDSTDTDEETPSFLSDRLQFLGEQLADGQPGRSTDGVGTIQAIRDGTETVGEEIRSQDDDACPHCGLDLPEGGPPICPGCGAPR